MRIKSVTSKALQLDLDGYLKPGGEYPFFALSEDAIDSASRAAYWTDESPKDVIIIEIVFTAAGIATLMPDVLTAHDEDCGYRFYDTIYKTYSSADHVLLYSVSDIKQQIM
jgi:hypothetical protein